MIFFLLDCWDNNPDNRPTISDVVDRLKKIITADNLDNSNNLSNSLQEQNSNVDVINNLAPSDPYWNMNEVVKALGSNSSESVNASWRTNDVLKIFKEISGVVSLTCKKSGEKSTNVSREIIWENIDSKESGGDH